MFVSAGAGTGKTRVLVERFARTVLERNIAPGPDPRHHLHRARRGRAGGPDPAAARRGGPRRAGAGARRRLDLDHPRLLRPRSCAATRCRPGSIRRSSCSTRPPPTCCARSRYDRALRELALARDDVLDLVTAYGEDRLRTLIDGTHERLRTAGHPLRFEPAAGGRPRRGDRARPRRRARPREDARPGRAPRRVAGPRAGARRAARASAGAGRAGGAAPTTPRAAGWRWRATTTPPWPIWSAPRATPCSRGCGRCSTSCCRRSRPSTPAASGPPRASTSTTSSWRRGAS